MSTTTRYAFEIDDAGDESYYREPYIRHVHAVIEAQLQGALRVNGAGVLPYPDADSLLVSEGTGKQVLIEAGVGYAEHSTYGIIALATDTQATCDEMSDASDFPDDGTIYIYATIQVSVGVNDSRETNLPKFVGSLASTYDGGLKLASVTLVAGAITDVTDLRTIIDSSDADLFDGELPAFYLDRANHTGTQAISTITDLQDELDAKADTSYVDAAVTGLLDLKGGTDTSANPNYPAASKGDAYFVTVAGKVGGASGKTVNVGDVYFATADNAGGTEASVGTSWLVLEASAVDWANIVNKPSVFPPDITGMTADTSPADADYLGTYNAGAAANRKVTFLNFANYVIAKMLGADRAPLGVWTFIKSLVFTPNTPATITSTVSNYALPDAATVRLASDAHTRQITGFVAGADGVEKTLTNAGTYNITLRNENTGSSAANRFVSPTGTGLVMRPGASLVIYYDGTTQRWRPKERPEPSGINLVANSGFQRWGTSLPKGWTSISGTNWSSGSNIAQEATIVDEPPYSAKIGDGTNAIRGGAMEALIPVIPGENYILAARLQGGDATAVFRFCLKVFEDDGTTEIITGTPLGNGWTYSSGVGAWVTETTPGTAWIDFTRGILTESTVFYVRVGLIYGGSGATSHYIFVDRVVLALGLALPSWHRRPLNDSGDQTCFGGIYLETTTGALGLPVLTTTQRDALTPGEGWTIWNTTDGEVQTYDGVSAWVAGTGGGGSGDLLAANNLSDVANAATAFSNIKQAASDTATGVVELATTAEATTGTDTARAVTPAGLKAHVDARKLDDLATPDDNTDLNATTSAHGLLKKLDNDATHFMNGQGNWTAPAGGVTQIQAVLFGRLFNG